MPDSESQATGKSLTRQTAAQYKAAPVWLPTKIGVRRTMRHHLGILLQIIALTGLPLLIVYQLNFGFQLLVMPICTVIGMVVFWIGTRLRES